ncbi:MAG: hypothetical protein KKD64_06435 [Alphaproteobacteria bacterium]|nr:hypothetical protein [Alphaproteobacteria bacterium]MBU0794223.1 hypothetical protein [Alphaproteobacteria bacterium]MBU0876574.1 hypothetical protein [Alphaproteobacteria bacterium]MBU1769275.1 hypothetical protein [Alphaproteobacteria bacterium]
MIKTVTLPLAAALLAIAVAAPQAAQEDPWWDPDEGRTFPAQLEYANANGTLRLLLEDGPMETEGHPFFTSKGPDGRACVTCHQPADAMSLSIESIQRQWERRGAKDPLFAASDGSNCPSLPQGERASHSLLLDHGLIRIARPWPGKDYEGKPLKPDFTIEVVRDPSTCNLDKRYGLNSDEPHISVFRRPRPVANFKYIEAMGFAYDPKAGMPLTVDPETGKPVSGNLMADGRVLSLTAQMRDAASAHLGFLDELDAKDMERILDFERRIYVAQQRDAKGGDVDAAGALGGPMTLMTSRAGLLGSDGGMPVWAEFEAWEKMSDAEKAKLPKDVLEFRESVARGARAFREKTFLISDTSGINTPIGFGNPVRNSCVFCHNMSHMGMDVAPGQVDLGTTNMPFADPAPHLPLFRITCTGKPHPHYGRTILTHDPGYALTTGRCSDVGRITLQTMRGLSARAPYFSNGSAKDLRAVVDYYDRRYTIGYTEQEKTDLVNLMRAL